MDANSRRDVLLLAGMTTSGLLLSPRGYATAAEPVRGDAEKGHASRKYEVIVVTGASPGGIGFEIARQLCEQQYSVIPACRSREKSQMTADALRAAVDGASVYALEGGCDLGSIRGVTAYAEELMNGSGVLSSGRRLRALVNNAGVGWKAAENLTEDGLEEQFAVNHLGHFVLTNKIISSLTDRAASMSVPRLRVVNLSSSAHYAGVTDAASLVRTGRAENRPYTRFGAYCDSKLANVLFTKELARRFGGRVVSAAVHPGIVNTKLIRNVVPEWVMEEKEAHPGRDRTLAKAFGLRSPSEGAEGAVWLASDNSDDDRIQGRYFNGPDDERVPARAAQSTELAMRLWAASEVLVARALGESAPRGSEDVALAETPAGDSIDMLAPSSGVANLGRMLLTNF